MATDKNKWTLNENMSPGVSISKSQENPATIHGASTMQPALDEADVADISPDQI